MSKKKKYCLFWSCALAMKECNHEDYVVAREKMTMEEALKKHRDLSFCEDWVLDGAEKGEDSSSSHRLLRICCPKQYDKNEESSIYKEFRRHAKWLRFASKCEEMWQEYVGIPSPLPSCKLTKSVCDYESCPRNIWKKESLK